MDTTVPAERLPAGVLDQVANQVLLYSCFSLQAAGQVAIWAHARLRLLCAANTFPLQVTTASGEMVCVDAVCCPTPTPPDAMHPCLVDLQQAFATICGLIGIGSLCAMMLLLLCKLKSVQLLLLNFWRESALVVSIGAVSSQCVLRPFCATAA